VELRRSATVLPLVGAFAAIPAYCGVEAKAEAEWATDTEWFQYRITWRPAGDR